MVRFSDPEAMTVNRAGWFGGGFFFAVVELPLGWQILVENFHSWVAHSSKKGLAARGPELCLFRPVITASFRTPFRPSRRPDPARQTECAKYILWVNFCPAGSTGNPSILSYLRLFSRGCFILIASGLGALFPFLGIPSSARSFVIYGVIWKDGNTAGKKQDSKPVNTLGLSPPSGTNDECFFGCWISVACALFVRNIILMTPLAPTQVANCLA